MEIINCDMMQTANTTNTHTTLEPYHQKIRREFFGGREYSSMSDTKSFVETEGRDTFIWFYQGNGKLPSTSLYRRIEMRLK
jgi:hypothetical protein